MTMKDHVLAALREEFDRWQELLAGLSEAQITAPGLAGDWSIKDVIAHLWAWQLRTNARLEAALEDREPAFPEWVAGVDPEEDEDPQQTNAWIYEAYRDRPWSSVYGEWQAGFRRVLESGAAVPERDLLDVGRFPWLGPYPLVQVLLGTYYHHHLDHLEAAEDWLG